MKNTTENVKKKGMFVNIPLNPSIDVCQFLYAAMEKYPVKSIIKQLFSNCLMESSLSVSPLSLAITNKKEIEKLNENDEATCVLGYAIQHWDELKEKGKEAIKDITEKK